MKLLHQIYQIGGTGLSHSFDASVYLIQSSDGAILLDCGTPEGYPQILENLKKTGTDPKEIKRILGTHGHYDHVGAAHLWKAESSCELYLHEADAVQVTEGDSIRTSAALLYGKESIPCAVDHLLMEGEVFTQDEIRIEVLHTPGHTPGSVSFIIEAEGYRLLVAGDAVWGGFSAKIGSDEEAWRQSLDKITGRHYDFYTFGHVGPQLIADADQRLREAQMSFANYYNPWFKTFYETYQY